MRLNDGAVDADGCQSAACTEKQEKPHGSLYRPDANGRRSRDGQRIASNGSTDLRSAHYFIDTFRRAYYAYDFSAAAGAISNR